MTKPKHDHDHDPHSDHDNHANDNDANKAPVAVTPAGGALASLTALATILNNVDTTSAAGRSGHPMLQFKREGDGTWMYGQRKTKPEPGGRWAVNPMTFQRGYICFGATNNFLGEKLLPVSQPMLDPAELPNKGFEWKEQWAVNLKCLDGSDAGVEVVYKATTTAASRPSAACSKRSATGSTAVSTTARSRRSCSSKRTSYPHGQYGKTWIPVLTIIDWMSMARPGAGAGAPPPPASPPSSPPPAEQPRRRRVG